MLRPIAVGLLLSFLTLWVCSAPARATEPSAVAQAELPAVIDGHADFAVHYMKRGWSADGYDIERSLPGQADVPRWRAGGINGVLVTVASDLAPGSAGHFPRVLASLDWLDALVARHQGTLMKALSAADFEAAQEGGRIALMPAIEGGDQIDGSLDHLQAAYARGVRSMGIVYDHHNSIGDGAMAMPSSISAAAPSSGGLSSFGREVVTEMNRLGMLIDLSHAAESTSLDTLRLSKAPVIFSHSGARALADTPRNLSDSVLRAVSANGGVVMVSLVPYLTTTQHWQWWSSGETTHARLKHQYNGDEAAIATAMAEWDAAHPQPTVTVSQAADQIEYVARVAGIDHVGIGSDFDGMDDFVISDLKDASTVPALLRELIRRGWGRGELQKLARGNVLRAMKAVETRASPGRGQGMDTVVNFVTPVGPVTRKDMETFTAAFSQWAVRPSGAAVS